MRALKVILAVVLTSLAVAGGVVVAAVIALTGLTAYLITRVLGRTQLRYDRSAPRRPANPAGSPGDAIEISATEVKGDSTSALPPSHAHQDNR